MTIAVLPMTSFGSNTEDWFRESMTDVLITNLAKVSGLRVISYSSTRHYDSTNKSTTDIAHELGATHVIECSILWVGNNIRISPKLLDVLQGKHIWADSFERDSRDILMLQSEIAQQITRQVDVSLTPLELQHLRPGKPVDPLAYQAYSQGNYFLWSWLTEAGLRKALASYKKAISLDPTHAASHAGLGYTYGLLASLGYTRPDEAFQQASPAVEKALRLDLHQVEVSTANAMLKFWFERDWAGTEREFRQALALNKNSAQLYSNYASFLAAMGRNEEAVENARQALSLDPVSKGVNLQLGKIYHAVGDYKLALRQHRETAELFGRFILPRVEMALAYCAVERSEDALNVCRQASSLTDASDPAVQAALGYVYAVSGRPDDARAILHYYEGRADTAYVDPIHRAMVEAGLGNRGLALRWLKQADANHSPQLAFLRVLSKPRNVFAVLAQEPEYQKLIARMKLPEESGEKQVTRAR